MSCLILTAYTKYPDYMVKPFIKSLLNTGYDDDYKVLKWEHSAKNKWSIDTYRLFLFYKYLKKSRKKYETVIISDLRDVEFQKDPRGIKHSELDCYLEDNSMTIGKCCFNSKWIREIYGEEILKKLKDKHISCSGVIVGTQKGIEYYLHSIIKEAIRTSNCSYGSSQGIHNYLIHSNKLKCRLVKNEQGDVYTVGYVDGIFIKKHILYNRKGQVPSIIHQHDRHIAMLNDWR
jgi:hypothetical protein